ncbi:MAG: hypothetical protein M1450_02810 [Patescibacteria group bacterium]|nr:hypothetical protein [Patescibacteria group bacterium]
MENNREETQAPQEAEKTAVKKPLPKWVLAIIVCLILLVLALGAYLVSGILQKTNNIQATPTAKTNPTSTAFASPSPTTSPSTTPKAPTKQTMLEVPQLGVKFPLTSDISDAYVVPTAKSKDFVYLKVHSLDNESQCASDESSTASISKVGKDEMNVMADKKFSESFKGATIGNYFYYIDLAQYTCAVKSENQLILEKVRAAFTNASKFIESL